jgi:hypothetical protein
MPDLADIDPIDELGDEQLGRGDCELCGCKWHAAPGPKLSPWDHYRLVDCPGACAPEEQHEDFARVGVTLSPAQRCFTLARRGMKATRWRYLGDDMGRGWRTSPG